MKTREEYKQKFDKLMESFNFVPQAGEEIVQCKEPYPPYWFVSNKGYVLSVWGHGVKFLSPTIHKTGSKNKNGERPGREWNYNYFCEKMTKAPLHKIIADHFCTNDFTGDCSGDIHHIVKKSRFGDDEWKDCNEVANLQRLPTEIHNELTQYARRTPEQIEAVWNQKAIEDNAEVIEVPKEQFTEQMVALVNTLIQQGVDCRVYLVRDNDQAAAAYPVAGIATHTAADGSVTNRFVPKKIKKDPE